VAPVNACLAKTSRGWGSLVSGSGIPVPVLGGDRVPFTNLDNAASTPPALAALDAVARLAPVYSNVHRGTGYKSRLSSQLYDSARDRVNRFAGADSSQVTLFTRNTTESINHVARKLQLDTGDVIITTTMEHHSNDLPWRRVAQVVHVGLNDRGEVDESDLRRQLARYQGRVAILAVTGASNVTGYLNPIHVWAEWVHQGGGMILVDAAQLAAHRPITMRPLSDPGHLDFLVFSGHKLYAPFGTGVLIGPREFLTLGDPSEVGGGTVDMVSLDRVEWSGLPDREEAGTPCVMGAVALAESLSELERIGWDELIAHETRLTARLMEVLGEVTGLTIYGGTHAERIGVVAFNLAGMSHALVAAILSCEWGIGVRNGCFCAHPYVKHLLGISDFESRIIEARIREGDRGAMPGAVRVSLGIHNTELDIDRLGQALVAIVSGRYDRGYRLNRSTGEYEHSEWRVDPEWSNLTS
jgi:cysteine desulfurase/selenocysteine lyase